MVTRTNQTLWNTIIFLDMKLSSFVHHLVHDEVLGIQTTEDVENQEVA